MKYNVDNADNAVKMPSYYRAAIALCLTLSVALIYFDASLQTFQKPAASSIQASEICRTSSQGQAITIANAK
jgi:hypothetical protein